MKKNLLAVVLTVILTFSASFCSMAASVEDPVVPGDPFTLKDVTPENIEFWISYYQEDTNEESALGKIVTPAGNSLLVYLARCQNQNRLYCFQLTPENMVMSPEFADSMYYEYKSNYLNVTNAVDCFSGETMTFKLDKYADGTAYELFSKKVPDKLIFTPWAPTDGYYQITSAIDWMNISNNVTSYYESTPFVPLLIN